MLTCACARAQCKWTELERPLAIIRNWFVVPIERKFVNSLDRFLQERMVRTHT